VATKTEVEAYQSVIDGLSTVAFGQIKALLQSLDTPNPIVFRDALMVTYPELMMPFMASASDVAAEWYTTLRAGAGTVGSFAPVLADPLPVANMQAGLSRSLAPLFRPQEFIGSQVLALLAGYSQKIIATAGRNTIHDSVMADPVRVGFARIPRADCCSFCGLLASRGAVYRSEASATGVVGAGVDASVTAGKVGGQGKGVKARGSRSLGSDGYHDHCRCVAAPIFQGADNSYANYTEKHFTSLYENASSGTLSEYSRRDPLNPQYDAISAKETLAAWRQANGTK